MNPVTTLFPPTKLVKYCVSFRSSPFTFSLCAVTFLHGTFVHMRHAAISFDTIFCFFSWQYCIFVFVFSEQMGSLFFLQEIRNSIRQVFNYLTTRATYRLQAVSDRFRRFYHASENGILYWRFGKKPESYSAVDSLYCLPICWNPSLPGAPMRVLNEPALMMPFCFWNNHHLLLVTKYWHQLLVFKELSSTSTNRLT